VNRLETSPLRRGVTLALNRVRGVRWEVMAWLIVAVVLVAFFAMHYFEGSHEFTLTSVITSFDGAVTVTTLLGFAFAVWGWRWRVFRYWLVTTPDLSGCWTGTIRPVQDDLEESIPAVLNVRQSLIQTSVSTWTARLKSTSFSAGVYCDDSSGEQMLAYSYTAWPYLSNRDQNPAHEGTAVLTIESDATLLTGKYWTDRRTRGEIELRKHSRRECKAPDSLLTAGSLGKGDAIRPGRPVQGEDKVEPL
jgi:hypothetical protein